MTSDNPVQTKRCAECGEEKLDTAYPKRSGRQSRRAVCSRCMRRRKAANRRSRAIGELEAAPAELPVVTGEGGADTRPAAPDAGAPQAEPAVDGEQPPGQEEPPSRRKRKRRRKRSKRKGAAGQAALDTQQEQGARQEQGLSGRQEQDSAVRAISTNDDPEAGVRADAEPNDDGQSLQEAAEDSPSRRKKRRKRKRRKRRGDPLQEEGAHTDGSGDDPGEARPGSKRKRKRKRRRSAASKPPRQPGESVYPDTPSVRPPDRVLKRFAGRYTTDPSILDDRGSGMILLRGWHTNGKRWQTEVTTEVASRMVLEGAAGVMHPRLIHKLYSKSDMRLLILQRDNYICKYCGGFGDTIDHVMPKSKGGLTSPANCVCACSACNLQKADKLLGETEADDPDLTVHIPGDD